jgi:NhaP-type Na+/H+ or K+/H+ antiporter
MYDEVGLLEFLLILPLGIGLGILLALVFTLVWRAIERRRARKRQMLTPLLGVVLPREDEDNVS